MIAACGDIDDGSWGVYKVTVDAGNTVGEQRGVSIVWGTPRALPHVVAARAPDGSVGRVWSDGAILAVEKVEQGEP